MNILTILAELATILGNVAVYGPVLGKVEQLILAGDWKGLLSYLQTLIASPPVPLPAVTVNQLRDLVAKFSTHPAVTP